MAYAPSWTANGNEIWFTASESGRRAALYGVNLSGKKRLIARVPGELELYDISREGRVLMAHHTDLLSVVGVAPGTSKERDLSLLDCSRPSDLSADGRTLVITEECEGGGSNHSVYLRKTDGSPAVRLGEGRGLKLSPDGKWVLASIRGGPEAPPRFELLPTGAGESKILEYPAFDALGYATWHPDGKRILFAADEGGQARRVYVQEIDGGSAKSGHAGRSWSGRLSLRGLTRRQGRDWGDGRRAVALSDRRGEPPPRSRPRAG